MNNTMTEALEDIERRIHEDYERYGRRVFKGKLTISECNKMLVSRLERDYSNLEAFRKTIHNMYMYGMITNFDEFKQCLDRTDELLRKLDTELGEYVERQQSSNKYGYQPRATKNHGEPPKGTSGEDAQQKGGKMRGRPTKEFACYKGDEFIAIGTIKELVEKTGYAETTLRFCTHPASKKRNKGNRLVVFAVEDE